MQACTAPPFAPINTIHDDASCYDKQTGEMVYSVVSIHRGLEVILSHLIIFR